MDKAKEKVLKRIGTLRDEAIELLADLVKADSVNPPGDTRKIMDVIIQKTQTFTQNYDIVAKEEVAPNILITINPGARPQLLYNGHLDTVPVGREDAWEVEPFGAVIKDNAMYGRGVADMKGGVGSMLMAAKALQRENVPLKGSLVVNFVSDEETGGARGARYLMEQDYYSPDMVVVGEITNGNGIAIGEKGDAVYGLSTKGRTAHASTPWVGINAIDKMVKVLFKMESRLGEILKNRPSGYLPPATMNVGSIQGGVSYNVVADTCNVLLDRRTLPGETIDSVTGEIQEIIDEVKSEDPEVDATLRLVGFGEPFETSPDESICQIAKKTLDELGLNSDFVGYEQVSDGRFFAEKGIPTILIGPGIAQRAHTANEHLELDQYMGAIKIYSLLAMNALGY
jgi:succinyl-diaminopimelate desuccinylase